MLKVLALACVAVFAATPPAQSKFVTSPRGFMSTEGNALFYLTSGSGVNRRYMSIDNTQLKSLMNIKSIAFRQDGGANAATGGPDKVMASINMGDANFGMIHEEFDKNYIGNSKKNVFPLQQITFPDWRTVVSSAPAKFTLIFPFKANYLYLGNTALAWDMSLAGAPNGNRMTDRTYSGYNSFTSSTLGAGCQATGQPYNFNLFVQPHNRGSNMGSVGMGIRFGAAWAPANSNVFVGFATKDANLTIPGWCTKLHAVPFLTLPLGTAQANGSIPLFFMNFPHTPTLVGTTLVGQAFAADASNPNGFVLSNGTSALFPSRTGTNTGVQAAYSWANLIYTPSSNFFWHSGAYIARLEF